MHDHEQTEPWIFSSVRHCCIIVEQQLATAVALIPFENDVGDQRVSPSETCQSGCGVFEDLQHTHPEVGQHCKIKLTLCRYKIRISARVHTSTSYPLWYYCVVLSRATLLASSTSV
jgi:hypothetical protein